MTRATLFGKRTLSLFLALLMLASALPAALAEAPMDDGYALAFEDVRVPASSKDVDTSTESGKMLKEYLEWLETEGSEEPGENTPVETWEPDPDAENGYIDGIGDLEMITIDLPMDLVSEASLSELGLSLDGLGVKSLDELDFDGDGNVDPLYSTDIIKSAARAGLGGLMNGDPTKAMIDWGKSTILAYVFGDLSRPDPFQQLAEQIAKGFREVNAKLDEIKKQIEHVLELLQKVLDRVVVNAYRADINDAANIRDMLKDIRNVTRMSMESAGTNPELRKAALQKFHEWHIDGNVYLATTKLGNRVVRTQTNSGKDIFNVAHSLPELLHLPWDHQQAVEEDLLRNYFLLVYMEQMAYCKLSLLWQIEKNKKNPGELQNLYSLYKLLFSGDQHAGVVSNVSQVVKSFDKAPTVKEDKNFGVLRRFKKGQYDWKILRNTEFTTMSDGGPYKLDILVHLAWGKPHYALSSTWWHFDGALLTDKIAPAELNVWSFLRALYPNQPLANKFKDLGALRARPGWYTTVNDCRFVNDFIGVSVYATDINSENFSTQYPWVFWYKFLKWPVIPMSTGLQNGTYQTLYTVMPNFMPTPESVPLKGEIIELRDDGFLLKPDEASLAAANEALKAQSDQYAALQAEAEAAGEEYDGYTVLDSFTPNDDGLLKVWYTSYLDDSLPENNQPTEVIAVAEDAPATETQVPDISGYIDANPLSIGDVVEIKAYNIGTPSEAQQAFGFVNEDGGDLVFTVHLEVTENNFDSAIGEVTLLTPDTLTLWQAETAQSTEEAPDAVDAVSGATADPGKEVTYLLTPDTKLDEGVAEGSYVRVTWKAVDGPDQPADALAEPQPLVSVALEEKPVVMQTAQGEVSMLGAATLSVMTDAGEKTFTTDQAQVEGELAEGAKVSVLYGEQGGELIAVTITVEEAPVGPAEVLTVDGTATAVSDTALDLAGSDGYAYAFDITSVTVDGELTEESPTTVVYCVEGDNLIALRILAKKPPVGPVEVLAVEGTVTSADEATLVLEADDGTTYAFQMDGVLVTGEAADGCRASVSYYLDGSQATAVSVTVLEGPEEPDAPEAAAEVQ